MNAHRPHRIVVLGGGAGGLELATLLGRRRRRHGAQIVLVDRNATHVWKPRLHELAVGRINVGEDETSYLAQARKHGFDFQMGAFEGLDLQARSVRVGAVHAESSSDPDDAPVLPARTLGFDTLVLALGSRVNDFGVPGVLAHSHLLDSTAQAQRFQRSLLESVLQADQDGNDALSIGIVGAGATGVELAAELHHALRAMARHGGLHADSGTQHARIYLVDRAPRVLPATHPDTSAAALAGLQRLGIQLRLNVGVERVTADALHLTGGERLPCHIKVWASGVAGHPIVQQLDGVRPDKNGRIAVDAHLRCPGVAGLYALGDCAAAPSGHQDGVLPPTAQVAQQQAGYLAAALERTLAGRPVAPFRFRPRGTLISLGGHDAAGELENASLLPRPLPLRGALAKLLYGLLFQQHRAALHGWPRTLALWLADRLRGAAQPPIKLH